MFKIGFQSSTLWEIVKSLCALVLVGVISFKIYETPLNITVDFPTLLSLLLALFSVALAALFYFKATETSNTFYDNTYNFTRDIAQLLVKIESGFGERLRHLDEGYASMRDYIQQRPMAADGQETRKKIEEEEEEVKKVLQERDSIISTLIERSQLHEDEKREILDSLQEKERELENAQNEIERMRRRLLVQRIRESRQRHRGADSGMTQYTLNFVIPRIGNIHRVPSRIIIREFNDLKSEMPSGYIEDMKRHGYVDADGDLLPPGVEFMREIIQEEDTDK